jgi:hypothetical protein
VACGGVRVLEQKKTRKTKRNEAHSRANGGITSDHKKCTIRRTIRQEGFRLFLPTTTWLIRLSVVGLDERAPRPDSFDEGEDDTWPGNTPTRLQKGRISKERGVDSEEEHTGCLGLYFHLSPNKECPVAPSGTEAAEIRMRNGNGRSEDVICSSVAAVETLVHSKPWDHGF